MIRHSALHRPLARLALLAALLMALAPSWSRLLASASPQARAGLIELCTVAGLQRVDLSRLIGDPAPPPADMAGADCPYCVLLGPLALPAPPPVLAAFAPRTGLLPAPTGFLPPATDPPRRGLGSRGPPVLS